MVDYCSVSDVKAYSPYVQSSQLDALIASLITTESRFIDEYLNSAIGQATYTETIDGDDCNLLATKNFPITAVSSVTVDGTAWSVASGAFSVGYSFSKRFLVAKGQKFPRGIQNVQVTYTAGYAVIPDTIQQCVVELVAFRLGERGHIDTSSKTLNGEVVSYRNVSMPVTVRDRLNTYKSYIPSGA